MIVLTRIDDRLVHGQVVEGWLPHLKAVEVVVVSDAVAEDETQVLLMRVALPENVGLKVLSVKDAPVFLKECAAKPEKVLVLMPGPQEVLGVLEGGAPLGSVNVGGLHYSAGKLQLGKAIYLNEEDVLALRAIGAKGVRLEGRAVPGDQETDILKMIGHVRPEEGKGA